MNSRNYIHAASALALAVAILFTSAAWAQTKDIAGKWYTQTGLHVITIYRAGPEYTGEIDPDIHNPGPLPVHRTLAEFKPSSAHVHFMISSEVNPGDANSFIAYDTYDLDLSSEGDRLIGTTAQKSPFTPNGSGPSTYELYRRE